MLRKKLLIVLSSLILLMLATAVTAIILMSSILSGLEEVNAIADIATNTSTSMTQTLSTLESDIAAQHVDEQPTNRRYDGLLRTLRSRVEEIENFERAHPEYAANQEPIGRAFTELEASVAALPQGAMTPSAEQQARCLEKAEILRAQVLKKAAFALKLMQTRQTTLTAQFRWSAIGLSIIFVLLINISMFVLLRAASSVLEPVDRLVEASQHLAQEDYDYRVEAGSSREFQVLGEAFNTMANNLAINEQRKIETLHQVARTMNHELNNALAIIELQLSMVARSSERNHTNEEQLALIRETLQRMRKTIVALTRVRRVVLTDYVKGMKMLDIEKSTELEPKSPVPPSSLSSTVTRTHET